VYNCHYKEGDVDKEFTVLPDHGYVDRVLAKELVKPGVRRKVHWNQKNQRLHLKSCPTNSKAVKSKSVKKRHSGTKRVRLEDTSDGGMGSVNTKRLKMEHCDGAKDDEEVSLEVNKLNSTSRGDTTYSDYSPYGVAPCRTLEEQIEFIDKMNRCGCYLLFQELVEEYTATRK